MHPRHPPAVAERGATWGLWGGVAATPLLHTQNCGMSRDRGVATPWSATGRGVASAPLSPHHGCFCTRDFRALLIRLGHTSLLPKKVRYP